MTGTYFEVAAKKALNKSWYFRIDSFKDAEFLPRTSLVISTLLRGVTPPRTAKYYLGLQLLNLTERTCPRLHKRCARLPAFVITQRDCRGQEQQEKSDFQHLRGRRNSPEH